MTGGEGIGVARKGFLYASVSLIATVLLYGQVFLPIKMMNIPGLAGIIVFYLLILGIGIYAAWRRRNKGDKSEEVMLAGRSIGPLVGIMTMTGEYRSIS